MNSLKEVFSWKNMLKNLNFFCELNLGLILTAVGIVYFKNPNHFAFGGTSGLSILLADLFPRINVGGFMWIINLILVVLGFVFLGIKTMGWTIYSSFALSFFVSVCEWLYPVNVSMSGDAMLDLVFAVFLPALGAAIVFDIGASTGGTDIVALILAKYTSMEIGKALMVSDILIVLAAAWRFGMGTGLYCIQTVASESGMTWILYGIAITMIPIIVGGIIGRYVFHINYYTLLGVLAGANTNPSALAYVREQTSADAPSVGYANVYPFAMFLRIVTIQIIIFVFG